MKLTASPHFPEKRIGYLGMMLLLTEDADVLMLSTNALKNDLNSDNKFVAGLSLCAIGNLATADMSRDLAPEVDKHLKSPLAYLRKKACLAMGRCLSKCPELVEDFVDRVVSLLKDKSHGVLITVVQLMTQVLVIDTRNAIEEGLSPDEETPCRTAFLRLVPTLVKMLRNLQTSGYSADHDVGGISDPFLQVQLLTLLRMLGSNNEQATEEMNDVLAQVASNTDSAKNAGNAILYECVQTIMAIPCEDGLRVLAVNILGRFLLNRDNNIRYVALNTLSRCIAEQKQHELNSGLGESTNNAMSALQRHRTTVVDCLKDPDVSIRQRALELIYHLVNESNVESLTAELLNYLVLCPTEHRGDICARILKVVDRYSPSDQWRVDTLITTLTIAGREASRNVQSATVVYISRASADIHAFAVHKLCKALRDDDGSQHGLLSVGVWCIGEYGELLMQPYQYVPADGDQQPITFQAMEPMEIVKAVEQLTKRHACPDFVKQRVLTAYVKLSQRLSHDPMASERLQKLLQKDQTSRSLEVQVRSCEYNALLHATKGQKLPRLSQPKASTDADLFGVTAESSVGEGVSEGVVAAAKEALARMPVVDIKILQKRLSADEFANGDDSIPVRRTVASAPAPSSGGDLLDLFGGGETVSNGPTSAPAAGPSDLDLLSDIFAAPAAPISAAPVVNPMDLFGAPPVVSQTMPAPSNPMDLFGAPPSTAMPASSPLDIFGGSMAPAQPATSSQDLFGAPTPVSNSVRVPGFSHGGLTLEFECLKPEAMAPQKSTLIAHFQNTTPGPLVGMSLQVAVPKYIQMEMEPPSSTTVPPGSRVVSQKIKVTNNMLGTKNVVLKVKVSFTSAGQKVEHLATCSGFPPGKY
jgi:AP-1 complex subunit gamma-1